MTLHDFGLNVRPCIDFVMIIAVNLLFKCCDRIPMHSLRNPVPG